MIKNTKNPPLAIYIHWPYCLKKCPYCDFASTICHNMDTDLLLSGYRRDIAYFAKLCTNHHVKSIFFGGGTPSLMPITLVNQILSLLYQHFHIDSGAEISMEANPDALPHDKIGHLYTAGINRLSMGVQALNDSDLKILGRTHDMATVLRKIDAIRAIFSNFNIDLIYARHNQTLSDWESELLFALSLDIPHYSLYQLTIEEGTPYFSQSLNLPSERESAKMLDLTYDIMQKSGIGAYEISNFAKPGYQCQHNLAYWKGFDYIGIGPAAHGRLGNVATQNDKNVGKWLKSGIQSEILTPNQRHMEKVMMNLRLINTPIPTTLTTPEKLAIASAKKWITYNTTDSFYTTRLGQRMLNQLILELI